MSRATLLSSAGTIKAETTQGANTALRVGGWMEGMATEAEITSEKAYCEYYFSGSSLINVTNTSPFKLSITPVTTTNAQNFTVVDNRATRVGNGSPLFITSTIITSGANNSRIAFYVAKNGAILEKSKNIIRIAGSSSEQRSAVIQCIESGADGDYFEIWAANETGTDDFTLLQLNTIITSI